MSVFNQSRKNVIAGAFILIFLVIVAQLSHLQLFSPGLNIEAGNQGTVRKVIYPERGIIYDRNKNAILQNTTIYDLMLLPNKLKEGVDTLTLCKILKIDTAQFNKKVADLIFKNTRTRPSVFESSLSQDEMAMLNESMRLFSPAFYLQERSVRSFPYDAAANVLGYTSEVDSNFLKNHSTEGYVIGDYAGKTGIERSYEKVLMGRRGIEYWKRDSKNRLTERVESGRYDTMPVAGQNLHTSLDIGLQELGEKLMQNKLGSIVAIDPKTGGILAMVSAPTYQPSFLSGSERKKHLNELLLNPALPLLNRTVSASYSPGSTFKTLQALVGLHEGVLNTNFTVSCGGAFYGCGTGRPKCLDRGTFNLQGAITVSDNTYFATVMQRVINNPKYPNIDSSLANWNRYMYAFGLGHKLGVDVPSEKKGFIPTPAFFNKTYGPGRWSYCTFVSCSIGQGEVDVTPLQVANEMAYIANKGWYITPHVVDSIEGGDQYGIIQQYRTRHNAIDIPDSIFEVVHNGMQGVIERGTGGGAKVPGITICGKTGTVENYYRGVKQQNHSFFCAFAPRENPKIAIMCVVENSGRFGGTYAAPIVGLMIEKYLKDSITEPARIARVEQLSKLNLMPPRIFVELRRQDSLRHSKDSAYLIAKGYIKILKDSVGLEEGDDEMDALDKLKKDKDAANKKEQPGKGSGPDKTISPEAILPDNKRKPVTPDTVTN